MKKALLIVLFTALALLCLAQVPGLPEWVTFERTSPTTGTVRWSAEPSAHVALYYISLASDEVLYMPEPGGNEPPWNSVQLPGFTAPLEDFLESPGVYVFAHPLVLDPAKNYIAYVAANNSGWAWAGVSSSYHNPRPPQVDFPSGIATPVVGGHVINPTVDLNLAPSQSLDTYPQVTNPNFAPLYSVILSGSGLVDINIATAALWGACYYNGGWHYVQNNAGTILFSNVDFDAKGNVPIILGNEDPTLPLELSSFAATLDARGFVALKWITQSESNLQGYRVFRNQSSSAESAQLITPILIPATNTSNTANYSHADYEVVSGTTYWYWLECVENNSHSNFYGPVSVTVSEADAPPIVQSSTFERIYPNPFNSQASVNLEVRIKAEEQGIVSIFNVKGALVRSYHLSSGIHNINWDGTDSKGNLCSSGVYFCKLSTPSFNQTRKLLLNK